MSTLTEKVENATEVKPENTAAAAIPQHDEYSPTTVVLAKVKGYPPWPAMVLEESLLPENIIKMKPKSNRPKPAISASPKKRKSLPPARILPIRFFSDDTYIWINSHDLKLLSKADIEKHRSGSKKRKDNLLEKAYDLADDPPDMELFVLYGSRAAPPEEPEVIEATEDSESVDVDEEVENEEPASKKRKTTAPKKKPALKSSTAAKSKATTKISAKAPAKATAKSKPVAKKVNPKQAKIDERKLLLEKKKEEERKLAAEYDDDWGLEDLNTFDAKTGNYIFDTEKEQTVYFTKTLPSAAVVQANFTKVQNKFDKISEQLVDNLLSDEVEENKVSPLLDQLFQLLKQSLPKTLILKSRLLRVLILTARKPLEQFPNEDIKARITDMLDDFLEIEVSTNIIDANIESEQPSTVASKQASVEPSVGTNGSA